MTDFAPHHGPVFAVYQNDDSMCLFGEPEEVHFCGIPCLKGVALKVGRDDWRAGLTFYLPMSTVVRVVEYPSVHRFHETIRNHYAQKTTSTAR